MVVACIVSALVASVVTGVAFIVFGKNNKRKIEAARSRIVGLYNKGEAEVKKGLDEVNDILK